MANTESLRIESTASAESSPAPARTRGAQLVRDLVALTKPRITANVLLTCAAGIWVAPGPITVTKLALVLVGTTLIVASANALNMWWERESDAKMQRTKNRPLPAGRMSPDVALAFGIALALVSTPMLFAVNLMTGVLGLVALVTYVAIYTPLKRHTHHALLVGAVPGAIPPLLGWTSVTGRLDLGGLLLFALMFFWQLPHFAAIALVRGEDYRKAGLQVVSVQLGERAARVMVAAYTVPLFAASLLIFFAGVAGRLYLGVAAVSGILFLVLSARGLRKGVGLSWAKGVFGFSLLYLVLIVGALVLDRIGA